MGARGGKHLDVLLLNPDHVYQHGLVREQANVIAELHGRHVKL
jgi:hypothetical protein